MSAIIFLIRFLSGAFGGNLAGELLSNLNLGFLRNSVVGLIGGLIGGYLAQYAFGTDGRGELYPQNVLASLVGGIIGGGLGMALAGWLKRTVGIVWPKGTRTGRDISVISVEETGRPGRSNNKEQS